ncbi:hypothetical protein [Sphingomonas sp. GC_Shp_3]|uniref:hypothetical protein n=1 Tax=Sphingomonas sp. GC_Shp_3 TaxID=2937383 RepID=UPI00226A6337|nr:hypothetical protein [Sphingomonas sp. GC_Shp_3]
MAVGMFANPGKRLTNPSADPFTSMPYAPALAAPLSSPAPTRLEQLSSFGLPSQGQAGSAMLGMNGGVASPAQAPTSDFAYHSIDDGAALPAMSQGPLAFTTPHIKPHSFDKGGAFQQIAGVLGPAMLAMSAGAGNQGSAMMLQSILQSRRDAQERQRELSYRAQQLQDQRSTWLMEQDYRRTHPALDEFDQSAIRAGIMPGTPEYAAASKTAFQNKTDPFRAIPYSGPEGEGLIFKRPSELGAASAPAATGARTPSSAAIAALAAHPEKAAEFDAYYGAGASKQYMNGGAVPGGAGSFPLYPARR